MDKTDDGDKALGVTLATSEWRHIYATLMMERDRSRDLVRRIPPNSIQHMAERRAAIARMNVTERIAGVIEAQTNTAKQTGEIIL